MRQKKQVLALVRLGLEHNALSPAKAEDFLKRLEALPAEEVSADLLVEYGLVNREGLDELLARLDDAGAPTCRPKDVSAGSQLAHGFPVSPEMKSYAFWDAAGWGDRKSVV